MAQLVSEYVSQSSEPSPRAALNDDPPARPVADPVIHPAVGLSWVSVAKLPRLAVNDDFSDFAKAHAGVWCRGGYYPRGLILGNQGGNRFVD